MKRNVLLLLVLISAIGTQAAAQNSSAAPDSMPPAVRNKVFFEFGLGPAFTNPPSADSIYGEGLALNAALTLVNNKNWVFSLHYSRTAFQSKRPPLSKLFGRDKAPPHTVRVISAMAGKSFRLSPKYAFRFSAGPGVYIVTQPHNVARANSGSSFFSNQEYYVYETRQTQNLGLSLNPVLSTNAGKWLGLSLGAFFHLNKNPALRNVNIYASIYFGRVK